MLIAIADGEAVGGSRWRRVMSSEESQRSRVTKPVDDEPAWSIVCFYVNPGSRRGGAHPCVARSGRGICHRRWRPIGRGVSV